MVDDAEVTGNELVLQVGSIRNHDLAALVGNQDTSTGQSDTLSDPNISGNRQVVELEDIGDRLESLLEVLGVISECT